MTGLTPTLFPALGQFGDIKMVEKTPIVEICSTYPLSALREITIPSGSATCTTLAGERLLQTTASGGDAYTLNTAERGRYQPGFSAECGIGVRIPVAPVGNQLAKWGYSDGVNGLYFAVDSTGPYVARVSNSAQTIVRQTDWNSDKLDGTGPSGLTLALDRGNIFQIVFSWYGYGVIEFQVVKVDSLGRQKIVVVHRMNVFGSSSIQEPNLPVMTAISNGGTATAFAMYVGGRQFSIVGKHLPNSRTSAARNFLVANVGTTLRPLVSVRQKPAYYTIPARVQGVDCIATADCQLVVMLNSVLTTPSWGSLPDHLDVETAMQQDTASTSLSGGSALFSSLIGVSGSGNRAGGVQTQGLSVGIPEGQIVTLAVRALTGTATVSALLRMEEDW